MAEKDKDKGAQPSGEPEAPKQLVQKQPAQATDKTIPGGKYLVGGIFVDCNGNPIKE